MNVQFFVFACNSILTSTLQLCELHCHPPSLSFSLLYCLVLNKISGLQATVFLSIYSNV